MARVQARSPLDGQEWRHGGLRLAEAALGPVTWLAPFPGQTADLSARLETGLGLPFPSPGEALEAGGLRLLWSGREQALLIGAPPPEGLADLAAVIDQSDSWAALELSGTAARDVLARLTPLDLRPAILPPGRTARSLLAHLNAQVTPRTEGFEILVPRSMAGTAAHEIGEAMRSVVARG